MLKNYIKIAIRNLLKEKVYTAINILGLAIGIAFCILTFIFVQSELTYDSFHENADQIYKLVFKYKWGDGESFNADFSPEPLGPALERTFPEIKQSMRLSLGTSGEKYRDMVVTCKDRSFKQTPLFVDSDFFSFFTFPLKFGNPETVLKTKNSVVLSAEMAKKYFGENNPVGERITIRRIPWQESHDLIVTGVAEPLPKNSSIRFDFLFSYETGHDIYGLDSDDWDDHHSFTFVRLAENIKTPEQIAQLTSFMEKNMPESRRWMIEFEKLYLEKLTDIHFSQFQRSGLHPIGNRAYVYILTNIALLVLLVACINFINLSIGRASSRVREIGVRKVIGARRIQLMNQFWGESIIINIFALLIGIMLAELFLPTFNQLVLQQLSINYFSNSGLFVFFASLLIFIGLLAGSYPALILSGFQPVEILRGKFKVGGLNPLGRLLVVVQFSLSIFLIVSTIIMFKQQSYIQNKDLGFSDEQIIVVKTGNLEWYSSPVIYKRNLQQQSDIRNASILRYWLDSLAGMKTTLPNGKEIKVVDLYTDYDFLNVLDLKLIAGRNFSPKHASDPAGAIIVNEAFIKACGGNIVPGQKIQFDKKSSIGRHLNTEAVGTIVGVVKDFHNRSLHHAIEPCVIALNERIDKDTNFLFVKVRTENIRATLKMMQQKYEDLDPYTPFEYYFLDDYMNQKYQSELRWSKIIGISTILAIFISCLGVFGLISLTVNRRTKEIGIRKVLGASSTGIVTLLSRQFILLVVLASVISSPLAWYAMNTWLQNFAYRTEMSWWMFALAGSLALVIALLTVSWQAIRAATANPVEALRYE